MICQYFSKLLICCLTLTLLSFPFKIIHDLYLVLFRTFQHPTPHQISCFRKEYSRVYQQKQGGWFGITGSKGLSFEKEERLTLASLCFKLKMTKKYRVIGDPPLYGKVGRCSLCWNVWNNYEHKSCAKRVIYFGRKLNWVKVKWQINDWKS